MLTSRKRQASLLHLPSVKTDQPPQTLPPILEAVEPKKITNKQLTQAISRFSNNFSKAKLSNSDELLRCALMVLKAFGGVHNNFQQLFEELFIVLRKFTMSVEDPQILQILSAYHIQEGVTYKKAIKMMNEQVENRIKDILEGMKLTSGSVKQLQEELGQKELSWKIEKQKLEAEIRKYQKLSCTEQMQELLLKVESQNQDIEDYLAQVKQLDESNQEYLREIDHKDNRIHDLLYDVSQHKEEISDLSRRLARHSEYFETLRDRFDGLLVKTMGLKEVISKVEHENELLVSERAKMINRAAVSFDELTPRPKYRQMFGIAMKQHVNSTAQIFEALVAESKLSGRQLIEKVVLKDKKRRLQDLQQIRSQLAEDIIDSKQKLNKLC